MFIDTTFRALGALACVYLFGFLVTVTSTAALNAAAHERGAVCSEMSCNYAAHHPAPSSAADYGYSSAIHTAALFLAGE